MLLLFFCRQYQNDCYIVSKSSNTFYKISYSKSLDIKFLKDFWKALFTKKAISIKKNLHIFF